MTSDQTRRTEHQKQITALCAAISGLAKMGAGMDIEDRREKKGLIRARLYKVIQSYGGRIDRDMDDAFRTLWGEENAQ